INKKQLFIALSIVGSVIIAFYIFLPQFKDVNASWRLFYWGVAIEKTVDTLLVGNGFGCPFINNEEIYNMIEVFGDDNDLLDSPEEKYIKAYHNSFITLLFHMGIFILLLAEPFVKSLLFLIKKNQNQENFFLVLSFLGMSTWCFFNVVLELPHSSLLYWLFFLLITNKLKHQKT
ncbi:MAG: hypothetical protein ABJ277_04665, partial [Flavobacteriaceae bacterium]